jgi:hypothetical protein
VFTLLLPSIVQVKVDDMNRSLGIIHGCTNSNTEDVAKELIYRPARFGQLAQEWIARLVLGRRDERPDLCGNTANEVLGPAHQMFTPRENTEEIHTEAVAGDTSKIDFIVKAPMIVPAWVAASCKEKLCSASSKVRKVTLEMH